MDWRERLQIDSDACLARLVASRSDFVLDTEQPAYRGGTHYVTFGRFRDRPAVFKFFVAARRWRNESACLRLLQGSGLVPQVFHEAVETLIVMERLGGVDVMAASANPPLARNVGRALGRLASFALPPSEGYDPLIDFPDWGWDGGLRRVVERCGREGRKIAATFGSLRRRELESSLARIEACLPEIECERRTLCHEDVMNLRVDGDAFLGLYDLEICRGGTPSMQLGAALDLCLPTGPLDWTELVAGFEERLDPVDRDSILAMHHLSRWLRICGAPTADERHEEAMASAGVMDAAEARIAGMP